MAVAVLQAPLWSIAGGAEHGAVSAAPFGPNLTYYRLAAGMTMSELARATGISQANIGRYERGEVITPGQRKLQALCRALGVTYEQLMVQAPPEVFPPGTVPTARTVAPPSPPPTRERGLFPRDGRILRLLRAGANPSGGESWLAAEASTERYTVQVIGDCLAPEVQDGDILVLDLDRTPRIGDVVALVVHGELHIKKVMDRTGTGLYLTSKRGDLTLPDEGAELIGVSIEQTRPLPSPTVSMNRPKPETMPPPFGIRTGADDD